MISGGISKGLLSLLIRKRPMILYSEAMMGSRIANEGNVRASRRRVKIEVEPENKQQTSKTTEVLTSDSEETDKQHSIAKRRKNICVTHETVKKEETQEEEPGKSDNKTDPPKNWLQILENIREMRSSKDAPVDTMGCERSMEVDVPDNVRRYQTLVSLMLSSQTKDQVTFAAMQRLIENGLNIQTILDIDESKLGEIIKPVGFWKKKVVYIKKTTQILREKYNDDIPNTSTELCQLPGVGPKMAFICLNVAWDQNDGIGVDTHVHRIANRLKWTGKKETKNPEQTRKALESWLSKDLWQEVNVLLVGFGQTICVPRNPKCKECLNRKICPSSSAKK